MEGEQKKVSREQREVIRKKVKRASYLSFWARFGCF
jgi:hypothetical protein